MLNNAPNLKNRQSGAVLITGLIFMVVLTIIVISALRSATLEERMAANSRNRQIALQAAEAVLRQAEASVLSSTTFSNYSDASFSSALGCSLCSAPPTTGDPRWKSMTDAHWLAASTISSDLGGVSEQPRFIIEITKVPTPVIGSPGQCTKGVARVTARGQGADAATVFLQTSVRFVVNSGKC